MKNKGFLLTEVITALVVLGIIMCCTAAALAAFGKFYNYHIAKQKCIAAAQGQLDCIAATGRPLAEDDFEKFWPKTKFSITKKAGQQGEIIQIKTTAKAGSRDVSVEVEKRMPPEKGGRQ